MKKLSKTERIRRLIAAGYSNSEIGAKLDKYGVTAARAGSVRYLDKKEAEYQRKHRPSRKKNPMFPMHPASCICMICKPNVPPAAVEWDTRSTNVPPAAVEWDTRSTNVPPAAVEWDTRSTPAPRRFEWVWNMFK